MKMVPKRETKATVMSTFRRFRGIGGDGASSLRERRSLPNTGEQLSLYAQYAALLDGVLDDLQSEGTIPPGLDRKNVAVEPPRDASHGDLATNAAMVLAKPAGTNPRALAERRGQNALLNSGRTFR